MRLSRTLALTLACSALFGALPALAQDAPDSDTAATASLEVGPTRFVQLQAGLGLSPAAATPVPYYYTELGASFEQTIVAPIGVRVGAEMMPSALNQWMVTGKGAKTSFWGYSGDLDLTLAAARHGTGGPLPYIALGNRIAQIDPMSDASPSAAFPTYSMSLVLGVKLDNGLAIETRYPLFSTNNGGPNPIPAYFETQIGWWRGF